MTLGAITRIDLLQRTLKSVFEAELGIPFIWGKSNNPRRPRPFGRFDLISGPSQLATVEHDRTRVALPSAYLVDVPAVPTAGVSWLLRVNGVPLRHVSAAGETQASLMESLVDLVMADRESVTAASVSASQFRVENATPGGLYDLEIAPDSAWPGVGADTLTKTVDPAADTHLGELVHGVHEATLLCEIIGADNRVGTAGSAGDLMAKVPMVLNLRRSQETFEDQRIVLQPISTVTDIGALEGGGAAFESRYTLDLMARLTSAYVEVTETIETVAGTVRVGGTDVPIEVAS